jgi:hypothetical protein
MMPVINTNYLKTKLLKGAGKAIPVLLWADPECSRRLRLPDFKTIGIRMLQGCQPYSAATFNPKKYSWYSFLIVAKSTLEP